MNDCGVLVVTGDVTVIDTVSEPETLVLAVADTLVLDNPSIDTTLIDSPQVIILQSDGGTGPAGPQGPPGPSGGFKFIYTQASPAATWIITHNANALVNVTLLNGSGTVVDADIVETSLNVTTVMFSTPQTGTAIIT